MSNTRKLLLAIIVFLVVIIWIHNVPKSISQQDEASLSEIFSLTKVNGDLLSFEEQILFIDSMVTQLHAELIVGVPIAFSEKREPSQLLGNNGGLCYDFSRTIEKQLILNGFQTRHVAVYLKKDNFWKTITSQGVYSHSLTEVKTQKGWMIVDSNLSFYALDKDGEIYSFKDLNKMNETPLWKLPLEKGLASFYTKDIIAVYGLYSRHGKFYPPYNLIPDYNVRELLYNF